MPHDPPVTTEHGLDVLVEILTEALAAAPWLARVASHGAATCPLRVMAFSEPGSGELGFAAMDSAREEVVDSWSYYDLGRLRASRQRMVAYAGCVARVVASAMVTDRLSDMIPAPGVLVLPELVTEDDFDRERLNVELEERATAMLRRDHDAQ
jgi:hypothetical protein